MSRLSTSAADSHRLPSGIEKYVPDAAFLVSIDIPDVECAHLEPCELADGTGDHLFHD